MLICRVLHVQGLHVTSLLNNKHMLAALLCSLACFVILAPRGSIKGHTYESK